MRYILKGGASEWQGAWGLRLLPWAPSGIRGVEQPQWDEACATEASLPVGDSKKAKEVLGKK